MHPDRKPLATGAPCHGTVGTMVDPPLTVVAYICTYMQLLEFKATMSKRISTRLHYTVIIPAEAFARDYGITGIRLSVQTICYHHN